jgi:NitT/TauT family transport system substrate-binding protein
MEKALRGLWLSLVSVGVFFWACGFSNSTLPVYAESPTEKVTIAHWGSERILLYLPLYIAMEEGFLERQGIEVTLKYSGNDDQVFASVMSGEAQLGIGDPVFAAIARERGFPGKVIAMLVQKIGLSGYAKSDFPREIHVPSDLGNTRIATIPAPSTTYTLLSQFLDANHLRPLGASLVQASIGAQLATLEAGDAEIAVDLEPRVSLLEEQGYRVVFNLDAYTSPMVITGLTTTEGYIASNPGTLGRLTLGVQQALDAFKRDPALGVRVTQKLFPQLSPQVVEKAVQRLRSFGVFPDSTVVRDDLWQKALALRLASKELKKSQRTEESVDNHFASRAVREGR